MSLMLEATYKREDGAIFVPREFADKNTAYVGEITDDRGTRRHAVPMNDHAEWKYVTPPPGFTVADSTAGGPGTFVGAKAVGNVGPAVLSKSVQRRLKDQKAGEEKDDNKE